MKNTPSFDARKEWQRRKMYSSEYRRVKPPSRCYEVPDGDGGTMRVQLGKEPDFATVKALQELARIAKQKLQRDGEVTPSFAGMTRRSVAREVQHE